MISARSLWTGDGAFRLVVRPGPICLSLRLNGTPAVELGLPVLRAVLDAGKWPEGRQVQIDFDASDPPDVATVTRWLLAALGTYSAAVCRHGHPRTPENTYVTPSTGRSYCRICNLAANRRCRDRKRGKPPAVPFALRTQCPKGHPYDEPNTRIARNGARKCRACDRDRKRRGTA